MGAGRGVVVCHGWSFAVDMAHWVCHVSGWVVVWAPLLLLFFIAVVAVVVVVVAVVIVIVVVLLLLLPLSALAWAVMLWWG